MMHAPWIKERGAWKVNMLPVICEKAIAKDLQKIFDNVVLQQYKLETRNMYIDTLTNEMQQCFMQDDWDSARYVLKQTIDKLEERIKYLEEENKMLSVKLLVARS